MNQLESHPLRITDRDILKDEAPEAWWKSFQEQDLHIRVLHARDLSPNTRAGLPDPYCKIICGPANHRTSTQRRNLDPDWSEEFFLEWAEVNAGKRRLVLELWGWDFWRPDELLGRGFIEVNALAFEPLEVLELELQLYPSHIRQPKDIRPAKQQQQSKKKEEQQQKQKQQQQSGSDADKQQLQLQPSLQHYLPDHQQSQQQQQQQPAQAKQQQQRGQLQQQARHAHYPQLGTVRVALWWAPSHRSQAFDVAERVSFCLLPGEVRVPPVVMHTKLGTLYEEPCIVYIKLSLVEVQLGTSWYLEYLQQASKSRRSGAAAAQQLHRSGITGSGSSNLGAAWADVEDGPAGSSGGGLLMRSESLEAAVAAVAAAGGAGNTSSQPDSPASLLLSGSVAAAPSAFFEFLGAASSSSSSGRQSPSEQLRQQQRQQQVVQQHLAAEPVFALARLQFGQHQSVESIPVRLRPGGAAVFQEHFVFATKRPLVHKKLVLEVVLRGKALPGGKLMARSEWSVVDLLLASPPPPTSWMGVFAARRNQVPCISLPLAGIEGGLVQLSAAAADADGRAAMYGVPALSLAAVAGTCGGGSMIGSPRRLPSVALSSAPGSPLSQVGRSGNARDVSRTLAAAAAKAAAEAKGGSNRRSSSNGWIGWLRGLQVSSRRQQRSSSLSISTTPKHSGSGFQSGPSSPQNRHRKPSPFGTSPRVAALASLDLSAVADFSDPYHPAAAAAAAAAAAGDDGSSPIAGLPVQPEPGALSGPLATLQLVLHRVELCPEPAKGWWVLLKVGPHWAKSTVRRDSDVAWQLSVPIYHPTTTLILAVFADAGRSKINFLGKLQYRISHLMYLNHREVVKSLKLRTTNSSGQQQQGDASAQAGGGSSSQVTGVVLLGFTCSIPDRQRLLNAYERSPYPSTVHHISLFQAASRDSIMQSHHRKVVAWLATSADPPIPADAAWRVLETGRERFKLARSRHNIQRVKSAVSWLPACWSYFQDLKAWLRPVHNIASVAVMAAVCFRPILTLFVFLLWRSVVAQRRLLMHSFTEYLGVDLGELFDSAGLLPSDFLYLDDDDADDAASTASGSSLGSSTGLGGGGTGVGLAGPAGAGSAGGPGGVRDLAAIMMFQPRRLQRLKRRYEQLLRISLMVQNRIDDIAMTFERLQAMVTGQDPLATALFFWRMLLLVTALWLVGPGRLLFAWWCWEVLRPPSWCKPPGVKGPMQFIVNLPSKSLEET